MTGASDIPRGNWVDRLVPADWRPYARLMRLDRPAGTWLLLWPCWWSLALAGGAGGGGPNWTSAWYVALFGIGAVIMRGAGCVVNDITDARYDAKVARTADRPIPSGQISRRQAAIFLAGLLLVGLAILVQFNWTTVWLGVASLALVFPYPWMKRITWWPQAWLGLTFNWGALMGWAAVNDSILAPTDLPAWLLYAAGLCWTLGYDTIYAHQDKEDDALIGVKSTARRLGSASRAWVALFYAATMALIALAAWRAGHGVWAYPALAVAGLQLVWQVNGWRLDDAKNCLARFKSNRLFGLLVVAALLIGQAAAAP